MLTETLLIAQNEAISPDRRWSLKNFVLHHYLPLPTHSHTSSREWWFRLSFIQRNTVSWNRVGIVCLELSTFSWMGLVIHGPGFSFCFLWWTVKCFLTDGCCMTCCHNKINPIPCKACLILSFQMGKKEQISQISETIYYL